MSRFSIQNQAHVLSSLSPGAHSKQTEGGEMQSESIRLTSLANCAG